MAEFYQESMEEERNRLEKGSVMNLEPEVTELDSLSTDQADSSRRSLAVDLDSAQNSEVAEVPKLKEDDPSLPRLLYIFKAFAFWKIKENQLCLTFPSGVCDSTSLSFNTCLSHFRCRSHFHNIQGGLLINIKTF